jgi:hypothetical protein
MPDTRNIGAAIIGKHNRSQIRTKGACEWLNDVFLIGGSTSNISGNRITIEEEVP